MAAGLQRGVLPSAAVGEEAEAEAGVEAEGIRGPGLNKRSASVPNHRKATLCFHVNLIQELTAECLRLSGPLSLHCLTPPGSILQVF